VSFRLKTKSTAGSYYSGLSGLQLHIPKYLFPEQFKNASRLSYYSSFFKSIEINSSFYKMPKPHTMVRWAASVPDDFKFTFKLWKGITHNNEFNFEETAVRHFMKVIDSVEHKKGCLLIQLPPGLSKDYFYQLEKLLICINNEVSSPWNVAVEFRNKSWYDESTYQLLNYYHAALVIQDIPKSSTASIDHESEFIYIRFHGPKGNYRDSYSEEFLEEYASYILQWMDEGRVVYLYFNNTMGDALNNLETLNKLVKQKLDVMV
jgi:uncharacterized protein YecE (DUF72 family)